MKYEPGNIAASFGYLPSGGLQFFCSLGALFSKDRFIKFHALQSLLYWILSILSIWPFLWVLSKTVGLDLGGIGGILIFAYLGVVFFVWPFIFAAKAYGNKTFYLPILGIASKKIVHYEEKASVAS